MPPEPTREALESLRTLTPRLNSVTELASSTIQLVESFLNDELNAGTPAYVRVEEYDHAGERWMSLEYRRVGPRFRVALVWNDDGDESSIKAWSDCTRRDKLVSFAKLPDLLAKIATEIGDQLDLAEATARKVAASLAELRPATAPPPAVVTASTVGGRSRSGGSSGPTSRAISDIPF